MPTFYDILGVEQSAEPVQLKKAYRRMARRYHPDVNPNPDSHEQMARINEAFSTLIDPTSRMEYDATLGAGFFAGQAVAEREEAPIPVYVRLSHRLRAHRTPIYSLSFTNDMAQLVSSSFDNEIVWWDLSHPGIQRRKRLEGGVVSAVRSFPDGRVVAAGATDSMVAVWEVQGESVNVWRDADLQWVSCLAISADGRAVATGSAKRRIRVNETVSGLTVFSSQKHEQSVT
ncbi:MAG: DnaJ domain-containing protein, partial [Nitrospirae bacterium]|nr:DnaJ domain-containing protein [Fimbriimonadaceae bacterium]